MKGPVPSDPTEPSCRANVRTLILLTCHYVHKSPPSGTWSLRICLATYHVDTALQHWIYVFAGGPQKALCNTRYVRVAIGLIPDGFFTGARIHRRAPSH